MDSLYNFDEHVSLCRKVSQKLHDLARVGYYVNLNIHERAMRIVYRDYKSIYQPTLATEIFKRKDGLNPVMMEEVFKLKVYI